MKIGVVADDVTGSNDIGICFLNGGLSSSIYSFDENLIINDDSDVIIIDTDSRFDSVDESQRKVKVATKILKNWGAERFINKTCSVFRGNIGAEFDAMQDVLNINKSMVVLGFPKNGRTTINGIHYVYDVPLNESQFKNDPIHPMSMSNLSEILGEQTKRKIENVFFSDYSDSNKLKEKINKSDAAYIIFDVRDDKDLAFLAEILKNETNICGSSAIAEFLPKAWQVKSDCKKDLGILNLDKGILVVAGSLTNQTFRQIEFAKNHLKHIKIDIIKILSESNQDYKNNLVKEITDCLNSCKDILIYTPNIKSEVLEIKEYASKHGFDSKTLGKMISCFMADICKNALDNSKSNRFISLGGDTSAAVASKLNINSMRIISEIETGVPTLTDLNKNYYFTLKSGSFGSDEFIIKAINILRQK